MSEIKTIIYKDVPLPKGEQEFLFIFEPDGTATRVHGTHIFNRDVGAYFEVREWNIKNGKWSGTGYEIAPKPGNVAAFLYLSSIQKWNSVEDCQKALKSQNVILSDEKAVEFLSRFCPRTWQRIQELQKFLAS